MRAIQQQWGVSSSFFVNFVCFGDLSLQCVIHVSFFQFFVIKKMGNRAAVDTYTFDPMLFQFWKIAILIKVFTKFCLKTTMMESNIFLFNKPLLMVAIMGKYFQCATRLIFKSIWCYSSDFKHIESATGHA